MEHPPARSGGLRNVGARLACIGRHWEALGAIGSHWEALGGIGREECRSSVALPMSWRSHGGGRSGTEPERSRPLPTFADLWRPLATFADLCRPLLASRAGPHKRSPPRSGGRVFHPPYLFHPKLTPSFSGFRQ